LEAMPEGERRALGRSGVHVGLLTVHSIQSVTPHQLRGRYPLVRTLFDGTPLPAVESLGRVSLLRPRSVSAVERRIALLLGYVATRSRWVRCDVAERTLQILTGENATPEALASLLGCKKNVAWRVSCELAQRAGLPGYDGVPASRSASSNGETRKKRSFRRQRHLRGVKQPHGSTVSSQK
jgi:hypothetical protein